MKSDATKRIALCWDSRAFEPLPGLNSFFDAFEGGGAFVVPIYWTPEFGTWTVALGGMFIPYENELHRPTLMDALPATRIANGAKIAAGHAHKKSMQFHTGPFPMLPEVYEGTVALSGSREKADAQIMLDSNDELMVLIQACSVINCANVTTADISASPALNKKRIASGKQPFFSYKLLQLSDDHPGPGGVARWPPCQSAHALAARPLAAARQQGGMGPAGDGQCQFAAWGCIEGLWRRANSISMGRMLTGSAAGNAASLLRTRPGNAAV